MKKMVGAVTLLIAACIAVSAQIGGIEAAGVWTADSGGQQPWTVFLSVDGSKLTGTVSSCASHPADGIISAEIEEGRISGRTVRFKCRSLDGMRTIAFTGLINSDDIAFTYEQQVRGSATPGDLAGDRNGMFAASSPTRFVAKRMTDGGAEFAAAVNSAQQGVKVEGALFVPRRLARVRSVLVLINSGNGWEGLAGSLYPDPEFRALSASLESSLLLLRVTSISQGGGPRFVSNAGAGGADALLQLLDRLASESRHPELAKAPLLLWGHSAGGSFATTFAALHPERTVGFVRYHCGGLPGVDVKVLSTLPALFLEAGKDQIHSSGTYGTGEGLWKDGRSLGGPWTFGIEPDATHQNPQDLRKANRVLIPWIASVIRQRLSPDGGLHVVPDGSGWLGNYKTGEFASSAAFAGPKREASWLPDETTAREWQVVTGLGSTK